MIIETVKMSSKGQVVIPQDIREELQADEGTLFAIMSSKDTILLKKVALPSKQKLLQELSSLAKEGKLRLQKKGIKEQDIPAIVAQSRAK